MIKRLAFLFFALASVAAAQGVRFSSTVTQQGTIGTATNAVVLPVGATIAFCAHPANAVPCTNKATTYTDQTLTSACNTSTQLVLDGTTTCVALPDAQDNWGVWVAPNSAGYDYTITLPGGVNRGPFNVLSQTTTFGVNSPATFTNLTVTGTTIEPKPNGRHVIDGTTYPATQTGLQQACNDASTIANGGGICEIPPGTNVTITSTLNLGSTAANQSARLDIDPGATLTVNIASASITNTVLNGSNVATYTAANTFAVGNTVSISGTTNGGGVFNVKGATITTASPTQFTVAIVHAAVTSAAEGGCSNQITGACAFIDGIHLANYSKLICTEGARNNALGTSIIQGLSQSLTTVRTVISVDQQNGNAEAIYVQGCQIRFFTVTRAVVDLSATFANSYVRDNIISNYTGTSAAPGILVSSGTGATGTIGPIEIQNNWMLPGTTSTAAMVINGVDPEGLGSTFINAVRLWDNKFESVAGQTVPLLTVSGNNSATVVNLNAVGNWFLPSTVTANGYKIVDMISCQQCTFMGTTYDPLVSTANPIYGVYLENTFTTVQDFHQISPSLSGFTPGNFNSTFDNTASPAIAMPATADYIQQSSAGGGRSWRIADATGEGVEVSNAPSWFGGNMGLNLWNHAGLGNVGQTTGFQLAWGIPGANRNLQINDPGANDAFTFNAAAVTLTNKTIPATNTIGNFPVDSVYGTYRVTADQTITAGASLTNIPGLSWTMPANTALNVAFSCHLSYSQATAAASDSFGIQDVTVAPTNIFTKKIAWTSTAVALSDNTPTLASTTATAIGAAFTPSAATTVFNADIDGMIEQPSNASTSAINIMAQFTTNNGTIKRGSYCRVW